MMYKDVKPGNFYYKDEDRRVEDYEYNAKTEFTISEQGEKMNDTTDTGRKQVSQQAVELKLSIDCLSARMGVLEEALEKVLTRKIENDTEDYPKSELVPLADFLDTEKDRITFVNCWIEDILNRLEL